MLGIAQPGTGRGTTLRPVAYPEGKSI